LSRSALLRQRPLVALLGAEVISTTGAQMTWLALPWFVIVTTHSATQTTYVVAAEVIGLALLGLPGGRLLGRLGTGSRRGSYVLRPLARADARPAAAQVPTQRVQVTSSPSAC
jgi:MFS family permease